VVCGGLHLVIPRAEVVDVEGLKERVRREAGVEGGVAIVGGDGVGVGEVREGGYVAVLAGKRWPVRITLI
jgi:hypothetical protein